ncbi:MAG: SPOR domain-containing protein [Gracilimonas sp.]|jgi:hypothetical protein|nr:SPOR domain-containing protein [Gracilimonas sp.]
MIKYLPSVFLLLIIIGLISCTSTERTVQDEREESNENYSDKLTETESGIDLESYRTRLSDSYTYRENKIPEQFNQIKAERREEKNLYEGYRVQIFSGQDVSNADTTAAHFRAWADTTIVGYEPETYVFFRTPYYRVHVGDFHERNRAISFSNIVKRYFRDAWVVYDRVNPARVPSDTTSIKTQ